MHSDLSTGDLFRELESALQAVAQAGISRQALKRGRASSEGKQCSLKPK